MKDIELLYNEWLIWSCDADKSEDGWESMFPKWESLIDSAIEELKKDVKSVNFEILSKCWSISQETEDLIDFSKENVDRIRPVLHRLSKSGDENVRWQIFEVLSCGSHEYDLPILERGLKDTDNYSKRRAILSISKYEYDIPSDMMKQFCRDSDPYIRLASINLLYRLSSRKLKNEIIGTLSRDPEKFVRKAINDFKVSNKD